MGDKYILKKESLKISCNVPKWILFFLHGCETTEVCHKIIKSFCKLAHTITLCFYLCTWRRRARLNSTPHVKTSLKTITNALVYIKRISSLVCLYVCVCVSSTIVWCVYVDYTLKYTYEHGLHIYNTAMAFINTHVFGYVNCKL